MDIPVRFLRRAAAYIISAAAIIWVTVIQVRSADPAIDDGVAIALAIVAGLFGPIEALARAYTEEIGPESRSLKVEDEVKALFLTLVQVTGIAFSELGITVFGMRRSRRRAMLQRVQHRLFRFRIDSHPRPTDILWTKRKGVLGECWRTMHRAELDHPSHFGAASACTNRREWRKLGPAVTLHHTWNDFKKLRGFGYVEAHPAVDRNGKYRGAIVMQVDSPLSASLQLLDAQRAIRRTAAMIAETLA